MKSINCKALSWIAIILSVIAMIITWLRVEVTIENDTFVGLMAGFMGACATILVGAQIYNSIDTRNSMNKLNESFEDKIKDINSNYNMRMEKLQKLNNQLQNDIIKLNKKLEQAKEDRIRNENSMSAYISRAHGISLSNIQPFTACSILFRGLKKALENNDPAITDSILHDMEVTINRIKNTDLSNIKITHYNKIDEMSPDTLKDFQLYSIINRRYKKLFSDLQDLKQRIDKSSKHNTETKK